MGVIVPIYNPTEGSHVKATALIGRDTSLSLDNPNENYGIDTTLLIAKNALAGWDTQRMLIDLILPAQPTSDATIKKLYLKIFMNNFSLAAHLNVFHTHKIYIFATKHEIWNEGKGTFLVPIDNDASWNHCTNERDWETAGGDYDDAEQYIIADGIIDELIKPTLVNGTHDGAISQPTLQDSTADFINDGVTTGCFVYNLSDGSFGLITNVTPNTITATLAGGIGNDWDPTDIYYIPLNEWYLFDLTPWLEKKSPEWGKRYSFEIKFKDETDFSNNMSFWSREAVLAGDRPYWEVWYEDPSPSKIDDFAIQPSKIDSRLPWLTWGLPIDKDLKTIKIYKKTSPNVAVTDVAVTTNKGASITDLDGDNDGSPCYESAIATENNLNYYAAFLEDEYNIDADATKSNEVMFIRPTTNYMEMIKAISTSKVTSGDVGDIMVAAFVGKGSKYTENEIEGVEKATIQWGDGQYVTTRHWQTKLSGAYTMGDPSMNVDSADLCQVGDGLVIMDAATGNVKRYSEIKSISGNTITLTAPWTDQSYIIGDYVVLAHKHVYLGNETYTVRVQTFNDLEFASNFYSDSVTINAIPPIAIPKVSPSELKTGDYALISGIDSYPRDAEKSISGYKYDSDYNLSDGFKSLTGANNITVHRWERRFTTIVNEANWTQNKVKITSDDNGDADLWIRVIGIDSGDNRLNQLLQLSGSPPTALSPEFKRVDHIAIQNVDSSEPDAIAIGTLTCEGELNSIIIATIVSGYHEAARDGYEWELALEAYDPNSSDEKTFKLYFEKEIVLNLNNILKDGFEFVNPPNMRQKHLLEGDKQNETQQGHKRIKVIQIRGMATNNNCGCYDSVDLSSGTPVFSGSGGWTPDDILTLNEIVDEGKFLVSVQTHGKTFTGWLDLDSEPLEGGDMNFRWNGSITVVEESL